MNVYVETNFILELALVQEQHERCERLIELCESRRATLVLPSFCIAESYETLVRRAKRRTQMANDLAVELRQLGRSKPYKDEIDALENIVGLLVRSIEEEDRRLIGVLERVSRIADVIPLGADMISRAAAYRAANKLSPQDSIVCSSVLHHLTSANAGESCFINRNRRDFDDPDIEESLAKQGCKMLFSFTSGCNYIEHRVNTALGG
jgi:predicted nucleic acid-binding protein